MKKETKKTEKRPVLKPLLEEVYAAKILKALQSCIYDDTDKDNKAKFDETWQIKFSEIMKDSKKATTFFYAVGAVAPSLLYSRFTGEGTSPFKFAQLAQGLCVQRMMEEAKANAKVEILQEQSKAKKEGTFKKVD